LSSTRIGIEPSFLLASKSKAWKLDDMDADHVAAWSTGGATSAENCQMLCKSHNRAKGNR